MKTKITLLCLTLVFFFTTGAAYSHQSQAVTEKGKLIIVGTGPGAADLITLRAINCIKSADVVICARESAEKFGNHLKSKKILIPPMFRYWEILEKRCWDSENKDKKSCNELIQMRKERTEQIRNYLEKGKTVVLLEGGDPCIIGCLRWIKQEFSDEEFEVVPGVSSFNAANAMLEREILDAYVGTHQTRSVILTTSLRQGDRRDSIENLAKHRTTMVFFMPAGFEKNVLPVLKKYYSADTPVAIIYKGSHTGKEETLKGTIGAFPYMPPEKEWHRLIYVGEFLKDATIIR